MSHAFKIIPAKPTFGKFKENISYSDYINIKKAKKNTDGQIKKPYSP